MTGRVLTEGFAGVVKNAIDNCIRYDTATLPLLSDVTNSVVADACPLCGGTLTQMGWFRQGPLHEMLHKCDVCGLAVFR